MQRGPLIFLGVFATFLFGWLGLGALNGSALGLVVASGWCFVMLYAPAIQPSTNAILALVGAGTVTGLAIGAGLAARGASLRRAIPSGWLSGFVWGVLAILLATWLLDL